VCEDTEAEVTAAEIERKGAGWFVISDAIRNRHVPEQNQADAPWWSSRICSTRSPPER
jgi:hypothetical protein